MSGGRASWSGQLAFVLAAAASAIGLGNLWRFPYLAARYGGGAFIVTYFLLALTLGCTLMITEIAIGRRSHQSQLTAFSALGHRRWSWVGVLSTLVPFLIFPYYAVVGGWVTRYLARYVGSVAGCAGAIADPGAYFDGVVASGCDAVFFMAFFVAATIVVVRLGVKDGIERANKVMMPLLFAMSIAIAAYVACLPGSGAGIRYYLVPNFSAVEDFGKMILGAMGQMFYSLSLAMGIMIAYGSYMPRSSSIPKSAVRIAFADTLFAILAGFMLIPVVYAKFGAEGTLTAGPGLLFKSLPQIFGGFGASGEWLGLVFFALVFFAALTSSISMCEACVAALCDRLGWSRVVASTVFGVYAVAVGVAPALAPSVLDGIDSFTNTMLVPLSAIGICLFAGWAIGPVKLIAEIRDPGSRWRFARIYVFAIRYLAPVFVLAILVSQLLQTLGLWKI